MYDAGHQVASHTWNHADLSTLDADAFDQQIYQNEMAFQNILGVIPTYMRPPYFLCDDICSARLDVLGYHAIYSNLDTLDYLYDDAAQIQNARNIVDNSLTGQTPSQSSFLVLEHDTHYQSVYSLTEYILQKIAADGYGTSVTVGTCLNDPMGNWYRDASPAVLDCFDSSPSSSRSTYSSSPSITSSSSPTPLPKLTVSTDATCGGTVTCQGSGFGDCCSQWGWCGTTDAHCGSGCQSAFGVCA